ncbi:MAG: hypothetical protein Q8P41_06280, partial [Pseudomonadota bacterium]|nr:hypothetical protein [Pseudomonadota bacterium]
PAPPRTAVAPSPAPSPRWFLLPVGIAVALAGMTLLATAVVAVPFLLGNDDTPVLPGPTPPPPTEPAPADPAVTEDAPTTTPADPPTPTPNPTATTPAPATKTTGAAAGATTPSGGSAATAPKSGSSSAAPNTRTTAPITPPTRPPAAEAPTQLTEGAARDAHIERVMDAQQPALQRCYDARAAVIVDLPTTWTVAFVLSPAGAVGKPSFRAASGSSDAQLRACLEAAVKTWAFEPAPLPQGVTRTLTFAPAP